MNDLSSAEFVPATSSMHSDVTLCLTIGRRPHLLRQTLNSLFERCKFENIIAINDFRDEPTNAVFRELCPEGKLISLDQQIGHHRAVDHMYSMVQTPYVFHCEDDWLFDAPIDIAGATEALKSNSQISQVCLRRLSDFNFSESEKPLITKIRVNQNDYFRLDRLHPQWHGYTLNPHISSIGTWRSLGGFSGFKKERHISRLLRTQGFFSAYASPGACLHIGELQSVSWDAGNPSRYVLLRRRLKEFFLKKRG